MLTPCRNAETSIPLNEALRLKEYSNFGTLLVINKEIDDLVINQLEILKTDAKIKVDPDLLIALYKDLPIEITEGTE